MHFCNIKNPTIHKHEYTALQKYPLNIDMLQLQNSKYFSYTLFAFFSIFYKLKKCVVQIYLNGLSQQLCRALLLPF